MFRAIGRLDYAFNNAGIGPMVNAYPWYLQSNALKRYGNKPIDINLKGAWFCMKYEINQMLNQGYGVIVNTSSVGAVKPALGFCAYNASKSGLIALTKTAALEYAESGIRVNALLPAFTERTLLMDYLTSSEPGTKERIMDMIPMKHLATPENMAETVIWPCSDEAAFITGHATSVDGGMFVG